jgi:CubicO group peptidase (beta-lactamase class C family)
MSCSTLRRARRIILALVSSFASAAATSADAQARPVSWTRAVDAVFAAYGSNQSPGCAVALFADGRIIYERAAGGALDGLSVDAGRVRGVRFVKR